MPEIKSKSQNFLLPLGVAFAVTASLPLSSLAEEAATGPDRLSALRTAASSGELALQLQNGTPAADQLQLAGFDNGAPADPQPPPPPLAPPTEPGQW